MRIGVTAHPSLPDKKLGLKLDYGRGGCAIAQILILILKNHQSIRVFEFKE